MQRRPWLIVEKTSDIPLDIFFFKILGVISHWSFVKCLQCVIADKGWIWAVFLKWQLIIERPSYLPSQKYKFSRFLIKSTWNQRLNLISYKTGVKSFSQVTFIKIILYICYNVVVSIIEIVIDIILHQMKYIWYR